MNKTILKEIEKEFDEMSPSVLWNKSSLEEAVLLKNNIALLNKEIKKEVARLKPEIQSDSFDSLDLSGRWNRLEFLLDELYPLIFTSKEFNVDFEDFSLEYIQDIESFAEDLHENGMEILESLNEFIKEFELKIKLTQDFHKATENILIQHGLLDKEITLENTINQLTEGYSFSEIYKEWENNKDNIDVYTSNVKETYLDKIVKDFENRNVAEINSTIENSEADVSKRVKRAR